MDPEERALQRGCNHGFNRLCRPWAHQWILQVFTEPYRDPFLLDLPGASHVSKPSRPPFLASLLLDLL